MEQGPHIPWTVPEQVRYFQVLPATLSVLSCTLYSVHGEYRLSPMEMPPLVERSDVRIGGEDMHAYMTAFASRFLEDKIQYGLNVRRIRRNPSGPG